MHKPMTKPQTQLFWRLFSKSCDAQGIPSNERDAYRKTIMLEECNAHHLADLDRCADFDRIMIRLALDSEDYELAARFDCGDERRMAHLVEICAAQLMQLQGVEESAALAYVVGVIQQAGYPARTDGRVWWLDLAEGQLTALFEMLDTHRRRLLKRVGWDTGLTFHAGYSYVRQANGVELIREPTPPDQLLIRVA